MVLGIYGAGGLGKEILELAKIINSKENRWDEIIFIIDGVGGNIVNGVNVYSYEKVITKYKDNIEISLGIGEPASRERLFKKIRNDGLKVTTLVHPDVYIPETTTIGNGVTIQQGCFVSCNVSIGDYVFVQPHASIGHDNNLHEGAIISSGVYLSGHTNVGRYTYIGVGSCTKQDINIGEYSIIGMGSMVQRDIPDGVIAMGNPARPMKKNEEHQVFK